MSLEREPTIRREQRENAAGPENAANLSQSPRLVGDMLEDFVEQDAIEALVGERQRFGFGPLELQIGRSDGAAARLIDSFLNYVDSDNGIDDLRERTTIAAVCAPAVEPPTMEDSGRPKNAESIPDVEKSRRGPTGFQPSLRIDRRDSTSAGRSVANRHG